MLGAMSSRPAFVKQTMQRQRVCPDAEIDRTADPGATTGYDR